MDKRIQRFICFELARVNVKRLDSESRDQLYWNYYRITDRWASDISSDEKFRILDEELSKKH